MKIPNAIRMDAPDKIAANIGIVSRVDVGQDRSGGLGLDRPYNDNYVIGDNNAAHRFMATVPGGIEEMSGKELQNRFSGDIKLRLGKVHFEASIDKLQEVHTLRSIDNLFLTIADVAFNWAENNTEGYLSSSKMLKIFIHLL